MNKLGRQMKVVVIGLTVCSLAVLFGIMPMAGKEIIYEYPEFSSRFQPWMIFLCICAVPWYIILYYGWRIAVNAGRDLLFIQDNVSFLRRSAFLFRTDALVVLAGNIVLWLVNMNHPGAVLASLLAVFLLYGLGMIMDVLSHFVEKAAELKAENDLTI